MKNVSIRQPRVSAGTNTFLVLLALATLILQPSTGFAQGTAFTYQGRFTDNGAPYTGNVEIQATLWDAASGGSQSAANIPAQVIVGITNGLFTMPLNFGANFPGAGRWLQLEVRTTLGAFTVLSPRQQLTPTPYAITASNLSGTLPAGQVSGALPSANLVGLYGGAVTFNNAGNSFTGYGGGLTGLDASHLDAGTVPDAQLPENLARTDQVWLLGGNGGTTPGTHFLGTTDNQPLELKVNGMRALRLQPTVNDASHSTIVNVVGGSSVNSVGAGVYGATIGGGGALNFFGVAYTNRVEADFGTIGGGIQNTIHARYATIGGGWANTMQTTASFATIGGGAINTIQTDANYATIAGGYGNTIQTNALRGTIGGGQGNTIQANATYATIGGGIQNTIQTNASFAVIGGGGQNSIQSFAYYATIPGGQQNSAASYSYAAGYRAKANHIGAFVWADSQSADFASTADNQFCIRAAGGVQLSAGTNGISFGSTLGPKINLYDTAFGLGIQSGWQYSRVAPGGGFAWYAGGSHSDTGGSSGGGATLMTLHAGGVTATSFVSSSDRNVKENFTPVRPREVLEKVVALPLSSWNYKADTATRHVGPMAQDFYAAFNVGPDDKHIATVDADGVALAAIQGLNQKLEEKDAELQDLKQTVAELKAAFDQLGRAQPSSPVKH